MGDVVKFTPKHAIGVLDGQVVKRPTTSDEFLELCKRFLPVNSMEMLENALYDYEIYIESSKHIRNLVDAYYSFANSGGVE